MIRQPHECHPSATPSAPYPVRKPAVCSIRAIRVTHSRHLRPRFARHHRWRGVRYRHVARTPVDASIEALLGPTVPKRIIWAMICWASGFGPRFTQPVAVLGLKQGDLALEERKALVPASNFRLQLRSQLGSISLGRQYSRCMRLSYSSTTLGPPPHALAVGFAPAIAFAA